MEHIHHYTSIKNLSLILQSQKIRFNRMDKVDDVREVEGLGQGLSKITYISSWTEEEEENTGLWKMYGGDMEGVRLSLPKDPFKKFNYYGSNVVMHLPEEELTGEEYLIHPQFTTKAEDNFNPFFKKVTYIDDYKEFYRRLIQHNKAEGTTTIKDFYQIGGFKSKNWEFQRESRFTIYCQALLPLNHPDVNNDRHQQMIMSLPLLLGNSELNKYLNHKEFIDLTLNELHYKNMVVTLGPKCSVAEKIIVEALLSHFSIEQKLILSSLTGAIR